MSKSFPFVLVKILILIFFLIAFPWLMLHVYFLFHNTLIFFFSLLDSRNPSKLYSITVLFIPLSHVVRTILIFFEASVVISLWIAWKQSIRSVFLRALLALIFVAFPVSWQLNPLCQRVLLPLWSNYVFYFSIFLILFSFFNWYLVWYLCCER